MLVCSHRGRWELVASVWTDSSLHLLRFSLVAVSISGNLFLKLRREFMFMFVFFLSVNMVIFDPGQIEIEVNTPRESKRWEITVEALMIEMKSRGN